MNARPRILCISLSPIRSDARVLRQIGMLRELGDVVTVGFGPRPEGVVEHHEVPAGLSTLPQTISGVLNLALRRFRAASLQAPAVAWADSHLSAASFDLVVANEARVLALAHKLAKGHPVWADMHEWAPEERTHILSWRLLVAPFMSDLCRRFLPKSSLVTTVSSSIAELYRTRFGVAAQLMRNAGPFVALTPSPTQDGHVRLVHSGAAVHGRELELMIDAMTHLDERFTLDLYLMPGGDGGAYLRSLQERAADDPRIGFHEPVAPASLPATLNAYDVGVFWIPPTHTNARLTLPNKFFDYLQARLLIAIGPSSEMEPLLDEHGLGVISEGFTAAQCANSLRDLTKSRIMDAKRAADSAAQELSFEHVAAGISPQLAEILGLSSEPEKGNA